jgi:hypothetical protein
MAENVFRTESCAAAAHYTRRAARRLFRRRRGNTAAEACLLTDKSRKPTGNGFWINHTLHVEV